MRAVVVQEDVAIQSGGHNTETFEDFDDCCGVVERALDRSGWTPDYVRRLRADNLRFSDDLITYGQLVGRFLYVDIRNGRPDIAALEATARLSEYGPSGKRLRPSPIRSPLKATAARLLAYNFSKIARSIRSPLCRNVSKTGRAGLDRTRSKRCF